MTMVFLGTGAAEGVPSYFCRCGLCSRIRAAGGRNIRSRTSFRIDAVHQIDFSPDIFHQMVTLGLDTFELEHLLITHSHEDHFDVAEILTKHCTIEHNDKPLHIYLSEPAAKWAMKLFAAYSTSEETLEAIMKTKFVLHPLRYFETYAVGGLTVTTIPGNHCSFGEGELAINYYIVLPDGRKLLYALDTGWYEEQTWEFLSGKTIDILIMECTFGNRPGRPLRVGGHLDIPNFFLMLDRMREIGAIGTGTAIYASHVNTAHTLLHDEMQEVFNQSDYAVTVAYDGMTIESLVL
ncbi:MAG: hypothetical protein J7639_12990 [Paenibacillaceae bacterium]|nr:hypothetical protein [Paenibacillaceae bacterium]